MRELDDLTLVQRLRRRGDCQLDKLAADRLESLEAALRELTDACESDCGGPFTDVFGDDEAVGCSESGELALTFGMIRRARQVLG